MTTFKLHEISSAENNHFKLWMQLTRSKGINKHHLFFLSGEKIVREFLQDKEHSTLEIAAEVRKKDSQPLTQAPQYLLTGELFQKLDSLGTNFNLLLISFSSFETYDFEKESKGIEVISPLGDPSNLGALARSCLAFGVQNLILTTESCHPFHPKALKSSAGALLKLKIFKAPPLQEVLQTSPAPLYALDSQGELLTKLTFPKNLRFLLGEEGPGLTQGQKTKTVAKSIRLVRIETQNVESLNASVAGSLFLFYLSQIKGQ